MFHLFRRHPPIPAPPEKTAPVADSPPHFLKNLVDSLTEGVLAVDSHQRIVLANPAMSGLLNQPPSEALGKPLWEVLRHRELGNLLDRAFQSGQREKNELAFGPGPHLFEVLASPLREATGLGVVLTFHDVTPLRRLENLRKDFVANVSHELKTPLTALRAALETLLDGALEDPDHARDFLQTAQDQTERLQRLIEDLLTLSQLEHRSKVPVPARCQLQEVATRVCKTFEPLAKKNSVSLQLRLPEEPLLLPLEVDELTQILFNLFDNALKFNRPKGKVSLRARKEGETGIIEVEDTGIGISAEDQARIFERFYRADKARTTEQGGTGLGLAIVKHLVENRGGTITVASHPDQGSTFTVRFSLLTPANNK